MRGAGLLVLAVALFPGCAAVRAVLGPPTPPAGPTTAPPPVAPVPATLPAAPATAAGAAAPATTPSGPVAPPAATIPPPAPAPPPAAPAPGTAGSPASTTALTPAPPAGPAPGPALTLQIPPEQERRLREDTQKKLDETERLLQRLQGRPLQPKERETLLLVQSFVVEARKALAAQEYERAANLASKAHTLGNDLAGAGH